MLTGPLPSHLDHRKLALERAELAGSVPVAAFSRLADLLDESGGDVEIKLQVRKGKLGRPLVSGYCTAEVGLTCQVCLGALRYRIEAPVRTLLVESEAEMGSLDRVDDGQVCAGQSVSLVDLIEDDLIINLPMVPRHDDGDCDASDTALPKSAGQDTLETHKPFAGLGALTKELKRS